MKLQEANRLPTAAAWLSETTEQSFDVETLLHECAHGRLGLCVAIPPEHAIVFPPKVQRLLTAKRIAVEGELRSTGTAPTADEIGKETFSRLAFAQQLDVQIRQAQAKRGLYLLNRFDAESLLIHGHIHLRKGIPEDGEEPVQFREAMRVTADMLWVIDEELQRFAAEIGPVSGATASPPAGVPRPTPQEAKVAPKNDKRPSDYATTKRIAEAFPPPRDSTDENWEKSLSDPPQWVRDARASPGRRGISALWDPVQFAICMVARGHLRKGHAGAILRREFPEWLDAWEEKSIHLD